MSRHRRFPGRRSRTAALIAAGAVTVATATAAAATWTSGPSAPLGLHRPAADRSHEADAGPLLAGSDELALQAVVRAATGQQQTASQAVAAYQIRDAAAELADAHWAAARGQSAKKAAASRAAASRAAATRAAAAQSQQSQPSQPAAQSQGTSVTATASASSQQIAQGMLTSFGWSSSQFSCLDSLWEHESGWSVTASNPGTGAYGIPQALPGSRMASAGPDWQTDAATQIRWGLEYIKDTYGSPCAAWSHEEATGWY